MGFLRNFGPVEIVIILALILLIFGWRRLPEIGSSMGKGLRTFKSAITGEDEKTASGDTAPPTSPTQKDEQRPY